MTKKTIQLFKAGFSLTLLLCGSFAFYPLDAAHGRETPLEEEAAHLPEEEILAKQQEIAEETPEEASSVDEPSIVISGDIRAEWQYITEVGVSSPTFAQEFGPFAEGQLPIFPRREQIRPSRPNCNGARTCRGAISSHDIDIDLNLYFNYSAPGTWAVAHIEFDNNGGVRGSNKLCGKYNCKSCKKKDGPPVNGTPLDCCDQVNYDPCSLIDCQASNGSGDFSAIALRKAYFGYNIFETKHSRLDIEVGRQRLFDLFDSRIQFLSQFDGVVLFYSTQFDKTDFYWTAATFLVNERIAHYGCVAEVGLLDIQDSGIDLKYSIIDWFKAGRNECCVRKADGWRYVNSQVTAAYHFNAGYFCVPMRIYGAFLYNHAARPRFYTNDKKYPAAGYLGMIFGKVSKQGDWSVDMNVQYVGAQAIPDADTSGISRGNIRNETLTMASALRHFTPEERKYATQNARGNANYKGFKIEGLYALTDNISIDAQFLHTQAANPVVGGLHKYNKFKLEGIYAF